jgi:16S rRNA (guanine(966)-N(2))-methyltransferase RsmD
MRIIAGTAKGRNLKPTKKKTVRPTADRVKETIFNVLGQWLDDQRVLDLYAGVGSLGLEALSRGATHVTFVERDPDVMAVLAENIRMLGFSTQSKTLLKAADRAVRSLGGEAQLFNLILADPPYAAAAGEALLKDIAETALLATGGQFVFEHDKREVLPERVGQLERVDERRFGDTTVSFYVLRSQAPAAP